MSFGRDMSQSYIRYLQAPIEYMMVQTKYVELSGQIIIFHQPFPPGFPWNKGTSIPLVRSCEVAIISPEIWDVSCY